MYIFSALESSSEPTTDLHHVPDPRAVRAVLVGRRPQWRRLSYHPGAGSRSPGLPARRRTGQLQGPQQQGRRCECRHVT